MNWCFGREDEYSLSPVAAREGVPPHLIPSDARCIELIRRRLLRNSSAVPFGYEYDDEWDELNANNDIEPPGLASPLAGTDGTFGPRMTQGVYHPVVGNIHKEGGAAYLEVSTPTFANPWDLARAIRRGQQAAGFLARGVSTDDYIIRCFNAVSDRQGREAESCGMHESYLVTQTLFASLFPNRPEMDVGSNLYLYTLARDLVTFAVLQTYFIGEGKIGFDYKADTALYQISARADFVEWPTGFSTTDHRPIVNTRDEPHADERFFARLHTINREGGRNLWHYLLGIGLLALFVNALENGFRMPWYLARPVSALHSISRDIHLNQEVEIFEHGTVKVKKAIDLLGEVLELLDDYISWAHVPSWCIEILEKAGDIVGYLKADGPEGEASRYLDWCTKRKFILHSMNIKRLNSDLESSWRDYRIRRVDTGYHRLDDERIWMMASGFCDVEKFNDFYEPFGRPEDQEFWTTEEPKDTRSYLYWLLTTDPHLRERTQLVNWDNFLFTDGHKTRVVLGDPRQFGKAHLERILRGRGDFSLRENRDHLIRMLQRPEFTPRRTTFQAATTLPAGEVRRKPRTSLYYHEGDDDDQRQLFRIVPPDTPHPRGSSEL